MLDAERTSNDAINKGIKWKIHNASVPNVNFRRVIFIKSSINKVPEKPFKGRKRKTRGKNIFPNKETFEEDLRRESKDIRRSVAKLQKGGILS